MFNRLVILAGFCFALAAGSAVAGPRFPYCSVVGANYNVNGTVAGAAQSWMIWRTDATLTRLQVCKLATANLYSNTGTEPVRMESGFYDSEADLTVQLDCFDGTSEEVTGHGAQGLQAALDRMNAIGKPCLFRVQ